MLFSWQVQWETWLQVTNGNFSIFFKWIWIISIFLFFKALDGTDGDVQRRKTLPENWGMARGEKNGLSCFWHLSAPLWERIFSLLQRYICSLFIYYPPILKNIKYIFSIHKSNTWTLLLSDLPAVRGDVPVQKSTTSASSGLSTPSASSDLRNVIVNRKRKSTESRKVAIIFYIC